MEGRRVRITGPGIGARDDAMTMRPSLHPDAVVDPARTWLQRGVDRGCGGAKQGLEEDICKGITNPIG